MTKFEVSLGYMKTILKENLISAPLTICSRQESWPCTAPGQHNKAGPAGMAKGEFLPEDLKAGELALLLDGCNIGRAS